MEKISWTDYVGNEEVLLRVNEQRNILQEIRKQKAKLIGHILRRNCLLKQVIKGKIKRKMEVTRRWERRHKKLLDELKDRRGYSHLKEEALDRTMYRICFGGGFGPVVRQNTEWMNEWMNEVQIWQTRRRQLPASYSVIVTFSKQYRIPWSGVSCFSDLLKGSFFYRGHHVVFYELWRLPFAIKHNNVFGYS